MTSELLFIHILLIILNLLRQIASLTHCTDTLEYTSTILQQGEKVNHRDQKGHDVQQLLKLLFKYAN